MVCSPGQQPPERARRAALTPEGLQDALHKHPGSTSVNTCTPSSSAHMHIRMERHTESSRRIGRCEKTGHLREPEGGAGCHRGPRPPMGHFAPSREGRAQRWTPLQPWCAGLSTRPGSSSHEAGWWLRRQEVVLHSPRFSGCTAFTLDGVKGFGIHGKDTSLLPNHGSPASRDFFCPEAGHRGCP